MIKYYSVKSNARRDAKKRGLDPDTVQKTDQGFVIVEPASKSAAPTADTAEAVETAAVAAEPATPVPARRKPREDSKQAQLVARLRSGWATATELAESYGWQAHTLRGAISTLAKKQGLTIERRREDGVTSYRVAQS